MSKEINFAPRKRMLSGLDTNCNLTISSLGPKGRPVWIDDAVAPKFTKDGATISRSVDLPDPLENSGNKIAKNTTGQTLDDAGDGTTTTACLLQAIIHEAIKRPENAMEIRESLLKVSPKIVKEIKSRAIKIKKEDIKKIALVSSENEALANTISEIINELGEEATITVEDGYNQTGIEYSIIEGYEANVGFISDRFANQKGKARCIMENVPVFVSEKKLSTITDISPIFGYFKAQGITQAVIVCDDIDPSISGLLVANKGIGSFHAVVIKAVGDLLKDIEAVVGATRVSDETGVTFQMQFNEQDRNFVNPYLGKVKKIIVDANKSLFIPESNKPAQKRAEFLQKFADLEQNMYIKERLVKRISQLKGQIAVMKIGGQDFEREYLKDKADDAIKASKVALQEGVVEGGGMCLWRISNGMKGKTIGEIIMKEALKAPLKTIIKNAAKDYAEIVSTFVFNKEHLGYNAENNTYVNMIEHGIIDPAKVTRCAIENSIANAAQFIIGMDNGSITDEYIKDKK